MKNSNDTIGNRTRDLPTCSAVPQLTALSRAPVRVTMVDKNKAVICCLQATSAIMLSEKKERNRKMWSEK